jgi:hypothetical protein
MGLGDCLGRASFANRPLTELTLAGRIPAPAISSHGHVGATVACRRPVWEFASPSLHPSSASGSPVGGAAAGYCRPIFEPSSDGDGACSRLRSALAPRKFPVKALACPPRPISGRRLGQWRGLQIAVCGPARGLSVRHQNRPNKVKEGEAHQEARRLTEPPGNCCLRQHSHNQAPLKYRKPLYRRHTHAPSLKGSLPNRGPARSARQHATPIAGACALADHIERHLRGLPAQRDTCPSSC